MQGYLRCIIWNITKLWEHFLHWKFLNLKIKDKLLSFQWKIVWCSSIQTNIHGHLVMVHHWHTGAQEFSLLFCSSLLSCRGEWKNGIPSLVQETFKSNGNSSLISFEQFLFCASSTSALLYPRGAGHGVSWLSYVQHAGTQNSGRLWNTDFVQRSGRLKIQFCWNMLWNMWSHGFYRRFLGKQDL